MSAREEPSASEAPQLARGSRRTRFDLVVVGDANPDIVVAGVPDPLPYGQRERLVDAVGLVLGGSGAITACGAARLGLRTAFVGPVGDDAAGRFVLDELRARDVDVSGCVVDPDRPTAMTVVLVADGGDRSILTAAGVMPAFSLSSVPLSFVDSARHVHVSSYFLLPGLAEALPAWFAARRAAGVRTSLDTNDDPADEWGPSVKAAIAETDLVLPNEAEALALTGAVDLVEAARSLAGLSRQPVIKRGADGASAWCDDELVTVPGRPATPVDTVGAGDSFNAGLIAGLLNGQTLVEAMELAVACGLLSTRAAGGTAAQPTWSDAVQARAPY